MLQEVVFSNHVLSKWAKRRDRRYIKKKKKKIEIVLPFKKKKNYPVLGFFIDFRKKKKKKVGAVFSLSTLNDERERHS